MDMHFEWTLEMSVGEKIIDEQHQRLLAQVNVLVDAMLDGASSLTVLEALDFLGKYANEHLTYEEAYMERRQFHDIANHKQMHQDFWKKYAEFKNAIEAGKTPNQILIEMEQFLGRWWIEHIGFEDRKYFETLGADQ